AWAELFRKYDLLAAPSRSTVSYPVAKTFDQAWPGVNAASPIGASNIVGVPAVSLPNGFGQAGLPTGLQLIAPAWGEDLLLDTSLRYQQQTDWHKRRPTLA
ncbi:MAG: amidase, partial [Acidobacteria bacterium]|nr:amidase [Acidobacteriota bacterium]